MDVDVLPGDTVSVDVAVAVVACTIVDARGERVVEPGEFELLVGPSSRECDLLRATFRVRDLSADPVARR